MMLTGEYARRATKTHKAKEGRELLATVRAAIAAVDVQMRQPSTIERGKRIGQIMTALEMAADRYDLFGENQKRSKAVQP